jgi:hypothetical protein
MVAGIVNLKRQIPTNPIDGLKLIFRWERWGGKWRTLRMDFDARTFTLDFVE